MDKITLKKVKELANNNNYEYLVIQGCGGDLKDWIDGLTDMFVKEGVIPKGFTFTEVYNFKNKELVNLLFGLNNSEINIGKLAILRLGMRANFGAMWLSDYKGNGYLK